MATERIDIVVSERGSRTVKRNLAEIGTTAEKSSNAVDQLKAALAFVGAAALVREVARLSDAYTELQNAIRLSGMAAGDTSATFGRLLDISNRTRSPLEAMTQLFQRGAMSARDLGASQEDLYGFVESVGTALALQGGSAEAASGALLQLAQALGGGIVRAEEFNSVVEGAFPVAQAAARGIDAAGGSVARLRTLVAEGKVTSQEFFRAILEQKDTLKEAFADSVPTISQAFTVLRNNLIAFIGAMNDTTGVAGAVSQAIMLLANNLDVVAKAAAVAGVALAVAFGPGLILAGITAITGAVAALGAALLANPIGALVLVLATATATAYAFGDALVISGDGVTNLRDVVVAVFQYIGEAVTWVTNLFSDLWGDAVKNSEGPLTEFAKSVGDSLDNVLSIGKTVINAYVGLWVGGFNSIMAAWDLFPGAMADVATMAGNALVDIVGNAIQGVINAVQSLLTFLGSAAELVGADNPFANLISPDGVKKTLDQFKGEVTGAAREVGNIVQDEFGKSMGVDYVGAAGGKATEAINAVLSRAQQISRDRIAAQKDADLTAALPVSELTAPYGGAGAAGGGGAAGRKKKETEELTEAQKKYKEILEATQQPEKDFNATLEAANKLLAEGKINAEQHAKAIRDVAIAAAEAAGGPLNGLKAGLLSLQKDSTDMAKDISDAVGNAFQGMEDALVDFVTTGKMDFGKLVDSIIADITRLIIRYMVIQPIINALSSFMGGSLGNAVAGGAMPSYATGGSFTVGGGGGVDSQLVQFMASPGERVSVSRPGESTAPAQAGSSRVTVNVYNNGQPVQAEARQSQDQNGDMQIDVLLTQIEERMAGKVAKGGGTLNRALEGRYALDAARGIQR